MVIGKQLGFNSGLRQHPCASVSGVKVMSWSRNCPICVTMCVALVSGTSESAWKTALTSRALGRAKLAFEAQSSALQEQSFLSTPNPENVPKF